MLELFSRYAEAIRGSSIGEIEKDVTLGGRLVMERQGDITISYAPFDYINEQARIVLVGITPGRQQATNSLIEARRQLLSGTSLQTAAQAAKDVASFSGPMRTNLIAMLDYFRIHELLRIGSCAALFGASRHLVHYTSALRYPVFVAEANYSGAPDMTRHPVLRGNLEKYFGSELRLLNRALFVPLGERVTAAVKFLQENGWISADQILSGLQHPSGANAERIAYLLKRKRREDLSRKTNASTIDQARDLLHEKVARLLVSWA